MDYNWNDYERFVQSLMQIILSSEELGKQKNIKVEHDIKLTDRNGIKRQFDVYWEYELGGFLYKNVIECKDYARDISIARIDELIGKLHDLPDVRGAFATRKGYQSGAKIRAETNNIDLLIIREQNDSDWISKDGVPLLSKIVLNINMDTSAEILDFCPVLDGKWIKANTDIDISKFTSVSAMNCDVYIEDIESGEKYSLQDLSGRLKVSDSERGKKIKQYISLKNAYLILPNTPKLKLLGYNIRYIKHPIVKEKSVIDGKNNLLGVVEYVLKGEKRKVFKNNVVHKI